MQAQKGFWHGHITLPRPDYCAIIGWLQKIGCIVVTWMEPQEPAIAMIVDFCILPPPPEPAPSQILSTTFEAAGAHLGPEQLKVLKAFCKEWDI